MDSSDDEGEFLPDSVTNYAFFDETDRRSVSRASLSGSRQNRWLRRRRRNEVVAWRYEIREGEGGGEVYVLCKGKGKQWVRLVKSKKGFEGTVRGALATLCCLGYVRGNERTGKGDVLRHLKEAFSSFEVGPSEDDILSRIELIRDAVKRDEELAKSEVLFLLPVKPVKIIKVHLIINNSSQVVLFLMLDPNIHAKSKDDDLMDYGEEDELFDTCCGLRDNGGDILCCVGRCMRSFHPTVSSQDGNCESLGLSDAKVQALPVFLCKNCKYEQHQCFLCGKLGSSKASSESFCAEVFHCDAATCDRFYHPRCVATAIHPDDDSKIEKLEKKIAGGQSFTCPAHKCFICKQVEERNTTSLQFAVCRRCPKAYHRKCLPSEILFDYDEDNDIYQRAWDGLLPKRILLYCLDHEIIPELGAPSRDHILFPDMRENKRKYGPESSAKVMEKKRSVVCAPLPEETGTKTAEHFHNEKFVGKGGASSLGGYRYNGRKESSPSMNLTRCKRAALLSQGNSSTMKGSGKLVPVQRNLYYGKTTTAQGKPSVRSNVRSQLERKIQALVKEVDASFNKDAFTSKLKIPSVYLKSKHSLDKQVTIGRVEAAVQAVRRALQKLEDGCSIDDAVAVCGPEILLQIQRWKNRFHTYLGPFLHGMRYSSYGRHFTKLEKLQEIVNRLHNYVQEGDTIVDFCCGANDFSWLMKEKLENTGKTCSFKNFDLFRPRNDFSFEERDWFTVGLDELPDGSHLIMGLNPPFGVKASLAKKFINKALSFKPKLIILIVPRDAERLDRKHFLPYDLVWEGEALLSKKSFYLPGSVDVNEKHLEQWNFISPPLFLWSRADWTAHHRAIARHCGHLAVEGRQVNTGAGSLPPPRNYSSAGPVNNGAGALPAAWNYSSAGPVNNGAGGLPTAWNYSPCGLLNNGAGVVPAAWNYSTGAPVNNGAELIPAAWNSSTDGNRDCYSNASALINAYGHPSSTDVNRDCYSNASALINAYGHPSSTDGNRDCYSNASALINAYGHPPSLPNAILQNPEGNLFLCTSNQWDRVALFAVFC
ncbi:hypothetical protein Droror1_Dr00019440 [Drosera rotundifolia]